MRNGSWHFMYLAERHDVFLASVCRHSLTSYEWIYFISNPDLTMTMTLGHWDCYCHVSVMWIGKVCYCWQRTIITLLSVHIWRIFPCVWCNMEVIKIPLDRLEVIWHTIHVSKGTYWVTKNSMLKLIVCWQQDNALNSLVAECMLICVCVRSLQPKKLR